jgi:superfamily II DNA/RNA helicase
MLDLGFLPDVEKILSQTPRGRQTMLFSATMPGEVVTLARRHLSQPMHIRAEHHDAPALVPSTQQHIFRAHQLDKIEVLSRVLQSRGRGLSIVFCRTKRSADQVASALTTRGFAAAAVHGDLGQGQRERAMRAFRTGKVDILVATDVAARGLDVDDVTHVINYECPEDEKAYLHRIGRTGRAGRDGVAVTFVDWNDMPRWKIINDLLDLGHPEPLETYSTSDHLFTDLDIPAEATGTLPRAQRERLGLEAEQLEDIGETGKTRSRSTPTRGRGRPGDSAREGERRAGDGPRDPAKRKQRVRRRTRGGIALADGQGPAGTDSDSASAAAAAPVASASSATTAPAGGVTSAPVSDTAETGPASSQSARRRRRRSSRGRGNAAAARPAADAAADRAEGASRASDPAVSAGSPDA